jgi:hypothetical protein
VDAFVDSWAKNAGVPWAEATWPTVERYPADWQKHGKAAGPMRNQAMIDTRPDMVGAFAWVDESGRILTPGTMDCVARALRAGLRVHVIPVLRPARWLKKKEGEPHG